MTTLKRFATLSQGQLLAEIRSGRRNFKEMKFPEAIRLNKLPTNANKLDFTGSFFEKSLSIDDIQAKGAQISLADIECDGNLHINGLEVRHLSLARGFVRGRTSLQAVWSSVDLSGLKTDGLAILRSGGENLDLTSLRSRISSAVFTADFEEVTTTDASLGTTSLLLGELHKEELRWKQLA
jgi:hypothetical protein